jgi:hypothetical protein
VDDASRFLQELRQLRDGAGLGQAELAARAHYPSDYIRAAEAGPSLPDLPVLSAYVRGCGGTTEEWEERWRSLTRSPSLPVLAARQAGESPAATAGARIGAVSPAAETPDPSVIMAALDRVAEGMAGGADTVAAPPVPVQMAPTSSVAAEYASTEALPGPVVATEPAAAQAWPAADAKPSAWDPIRVSSAWPTLRPTPGDEDETATAAVTTASTERAAGRPVQAAAVSTAAPWNRVAQPAPTPVTSVRTAPAAGESRSTSSRVRMVAIAAVLLCVLAVLLAIFA